MSWVNFTMDLATIPGLDTDKKEEDEVISPEEEELELRKQGY
ncbi:hypothetical protein [Pedobacter caeni]|nr:hypothetical protein [Pedobacter caeni]